MGKRIIVIIILVLVILGTGFYGVSSYTRAQQLSHSSTQQASQQASTITYKGENGKNALVLLKQSTSVQQDHSGLVVSINGRKSDNTKHEYWAFYVNGKHASVGPASYVTKNSDVITWKMEKY